jgi:2-polyprenyl-3-methyl-5-hydroxy-6-metoxy-1,4-benzoquinol methylase
MDTTADVGPSNGTEEDVRNCPLCGAPAVLAFSTHDRNRELSDESFRYQRCNECGVYSLVNVPADLGRFYPAGYYELPRAAQIDDLVATEAPKLELACRWVAPPGRLVEVGPGGGVFAYAARQTGFDVTAIEMDERTCRHLRDTVGVETIQSARPAAVLANLPASRVVAMWHVIEHVTDPWALVDAAAANLEAGGALVVATPNPNSLQFRLLRARWAHVDAPRHLFLLPLEALRRRAVSNGLRLAEVTTADPAGRRWNRFGWEYALRRRPAAGPVSRPVAAAALALTLALRPVEDADLRGAAYTAVFVKDGV